MRGWEEVENARSPQDIRNPALPTETNYDASVPPTEQFNRWILHPQQRREATINLLAAQIWDKPSRTTGQPGMTPRPYSDSIGRA